MICSRTLLIMVTGILLLAACGENAPPKAPVTTVTKIAATSPAATTTTTPATPTAKPPPTAQAPEDHQERVVAQVRAAERAVAYRISPKGPSLDAGEVFTVKAGSYLRVGDGAYPILSPAIPLTAPQFTSVRDHLLALDAKGPDKDQLMCMFVPGVAICFEQRVRRNQRVVDPDEERAEVEEWERTAVLLICYGCQEVALVTSAGDRPWWTRYFYKDPTPQAALFSLAKALFPADPDIQKMTPRSANNLLKKDDDE